jgi:hypothetical protein
MFDIKTLSLSNLGMAVFKMESLTSEMLNI